MSKKRQTLTELTVKVTKEGYWVMPDHKGKIHAWNPAMPISSMASLLAIYFGKNPFEEVSFKITYLPDQKSEQPKPRKTDNRPFLEDDG